MSPKDRNRVWNLAIFLTSVGAIAVSLFAGSPEVEAGPAVASWWAANCSPVGTVVTCSKGTTPMQLIEAWTVDYNSIANGAVRGAKLDLSSPPGTTTGLGYTAAQAGALTSACVGLNGSSATCLGLGTGDGYYGDDLTVVDDTAIGGNLTVTGSCTCTGGGGGGTGSYDAVTATTNVDAGNKVRAGNDVIAEDDVIAKDDVDVRGSLHNGAGSTVDVADRLHGDYSVDADEYVTSDQSVCAGMGIIGCLAQETAYPGSVSTTGGVGAGTDSAVILTKVMRGEVLVDPYIKLSGINPYSVLSFQCAMIPQPATIGWYGPNDTVTGGIYYYNVAISNAGYLTIYNLGASMLGGRYRCIIWYEN